MAKQIVDAAFGIHTTLGPGLLESFYHAVLAYELAQRGLRTVSQQAIPVVYGTIRIDIGFLAGLIVEDRVIVEIKPVEVLAPAHKKHRRCPHLENACPGPNGPALSFISSAWVARPPAGRHGSGAELPAWHWPTRHTPA